jgi:ubiquinone/menaquinone biosynthesis C-methylase UbiE
MDMPEHQRGYYDSSYLADYYESLWTEHPTLQDTEIYWRYLRDALLLRKDRNRPFVLLDVGTGTGRVLKSLIGKVSREPAIPLSSVKFIGMDPSSYMLERARDGRDLPADADVSWFEGSASRLQDLKALTSPAVGVDLLLFAFSGINHLHLPDEVDGFFASMKHVLRLGGVALVSVCSALLDVQGSSISNPYGEVKEVKSKRLHGIFYREETIGRTVNGDLLTNSLKTEAVKVNEDGNEEIMERNKHNVPLRLLTRDFLRECVARAGLQLLREEEAVEDFIFVFRKADIDEQ